MTAYVVAMVRVVVRYMYVCMCKLTYVYAQHKQLLIDCSCEFYQHRDGLVNDGTVFSSKPEAQC